MSEARPHCGYTALVPMRSVGECKPLTHPFLLLLTTNNYQLTTNN
jgi:hypothetical protein